MAVPPKAGDLSLLSDEQAYVVVVMQEKGGHLMPPRPSEAIIWHANLPVCTWPTLFSLLGREVLVADEATGGYALAPAWMKPPEAKK